MRNFLRHGRLAFNVPLNPTYAAEVELMLIISHKIGFVRENWYLIMAVSDQRSVRVATGRSILLRRGLEGRTNVVLLVGDGKAGRGEEEAGCF